MDEGSTNLPHSGSRWEPPGTPVAPAEPAAAPSPPPAPPVAVAAAAPVVPPRRRGLGRRGGIVALVAGVLALGGLGGFAVGQAVDGGPGDRSVVHGPGDGDADGDGFHGRPGDGDRFGPGDDDGDDDGDGTT